MKIYNWLWTRWILIARRKLLTKKERQGADDATKLQDEQVNAAEENATSDNVTDEGPEQKELEELKKKYDELNDSHLRLMAEFDNYRKTYIAAKSPKPDQERWRKCFDSPAPCCRRFRTCFAEYPFGWRYKGCYGRSGTYLFEIHVLPVSSECKTDRNCRWTVRCWTSEAVAMIPAPEPDMKGKVLDYVQTGYTLNDKVIRHAKVVVGE